MHQHPEPWWEGRNAWQFCVEVKTTFTVKVVLAA